MGNKWGKNWPKKAAVKGKLKNRINSRAKGIRGENMFCEWLIMRLDLHKAPESQKPRRNLDQFKFGRTDVIYPPFIFEIKNCEKRDLQSFWNQAVFASRDLSLEPIVAIYEGRGNWSFLITATLIGNERGFMHLNEITFVPYMERRFASSTTLGLH